MAEDQIGHGTAAATSLMWLFVPLGRPSIASAMRPAHEALAFCDRQVAEGLRAADLKTIRHIARANWLPVVKLLDHAKGSLSRIATIKVVWT